MFGETSPETRDDLHALSIDAGSSPAPLLQTRFDEEHAAISPDGRWLAYTTDEAGQEDIYVRPFPNVDDRKWRISTAGAREPLWGPDGGELFYRGRGANAVMSVRIETEPVFRAGTPEVVFEGAYRLGGGVNYDLSPNGQRFLMIKEGPTADATVSTELVPILNWFEELTRLVPTN